MRTKTYAWGGWKMPLLHPNDPDYCEYGCPICTRARQSGHPVAQAIEKVELTLTGGGCWWGRARRRKYGVAPNESIPAEKRAESVR